MFMGEYNHSIDAKGRLIVPAKFREVLGEQFVVTKGLDGCLFAFAEEDWKKLEEKLRALPLSDKAARKFSRFFLAGAAQVETDKQGRILIPGGLRTFAQLEKEVTLVGVGNRVEVWNTTKWEESNVYDEDEVDFMAEHMSELGI
jgi:MraZ protein